MTSALADLGVFSILVLAAGGLLIGTLGGLLGIGGGVIAVPVLLEVFVAGSKSDADRAALAIGTAQAAILLSSLAAAAAHAAAGTIDQP